MFVVVVVVVVLVINIIIILLLMKYCFFDIFPEMDDGTECRKAI